MCFDYCSYSSLNEALSEALKLIPIFIMSPNFAHFTSVILSKMKLRLEGQNRAQRYDDFMSNSFVTLFCEINNMYFYWVFDIEYIKRSFLMK